MVVGIIRDAIFSVKYFLKNLLGIGLAILFGFKTRKLASLTPLFLISSLSRFLVSFSIFPPYLAAILLFSNF
jgi:hypothetical protein